MFLSLLADPEAAVAENLWIKLDNCTAVSIAA